MSAAMAPPNRTRSEPEQPRSRIFPDSVACPFSVLPESAEREFEHVPKDVENQ
jgi:hypothetical protein